MERTSQAPAAAVGVEELPGRSDTARLLVATAELPAVSIAPLSGVKTVVPTAALTVAGRRLIATPALESAAVSEALPLIGAAPDAQTAEATVVEKPEGRSENPAVSGLAAALVSP